MNTRFCDILGMLRHERGISQRKAATELGVSQALLSHYENGIREPGLAFVTKACKYYDVTSDYLLGIKPMRHSETDFDEIMRQSEQVSPPSVTALASSLDIILKILYKYGDAELIEQATRYLCTVNYKLMRYIFMLNPHMEVPDIQASNDNFSALCNMEILLTELRFKNQLNQCTEYSAQSGYDQKYLNSDFPLLCSHLRDLLKETETRIASHLKEN